jgi:cytidylate kinase
VIAIDGPAAAGKGTLAKRIAAHFNLPHLDTGLLYRAVARRVLDAGVDPSDPAAAEQAARGLSAEDLHRPGLRGPEVDAASSRVAAIPGVRAALLDFQRGFAEHGAVLDGRDIGTVILPDAPVKLFVTARLKARVERRWLELRTCGIDATEEQVLEEMQVRDAQDSARLVAPMRPAPDAAVLDTTELTADEAFAAALGIIRGKLT